MMGMNAFSGRKIQGSEHLKQRLSDILTTPIGSRVKRRDYGSRLFKLTDKPQTPSLMIEIVHASAEAIAKWEREFQLSKVFVDMKTPGHIMLDIEGKELISGATIKIEGVSV